MIPDRNSEESLRLSSGKNFRRDPRKPSIESPDGVPIGTREERIPEGTLRSIADGTLEEFPYEFRKKKLQKDFTQELKKEFREENLRFFLFFGGTLTEINK